MTNRARSKAAKEMWKRRKAEKLLPFHNQVPNYEPATSHSYDKVTGLIDRMTQAIDKIQKQIERLESL